LHYSKEDIRGLHYEHSKKLTQNFLHRHKHIFQHLSACLYP